MMILGYRLVGFSKKMVIVVDKDVEPTDLARVIPCHGHTVAAGAGKPARAPLIPHSH